METMASSPTVYYVIKYIVFMGQQLAGWAVMQLSPALLNCWVSPMISGGQKHTLGLTLFLGAGQGAT